MRNAFTQTADGKPAKWTWNIHKYEDVLGPEGWCNDNKSRQPCACHLDGMVGPWCDEPVEMVGDEWKRCTIRRLWSPDLTQSVWVDGCRLAVGGSYGMQHTQPQPAWSHMTVVSIKSCQVMSACLCANFVCSLLSCQEGMVQQDGHAGSCVFLTAHQAG
jgi:hypothetical protein